MICMIAIGATSKELDVFPKYEKVKENELYQTYFDTRNQVHEVDNFDEINPNDLLKYGVIKVKDTKSIISNQLISEEAFNPNYIPLYKADAQANDKRSTIFYEHSYEDCQINREESDWTNIGECHSNERSVTQSTFNQGWSISSGTGISAEIQFAQIFGIKPSFSLDISYESSSGGTLTCNVNAGKKLQFQMLAETLTISNLKQRKIELKQEQHFTRGPVVQLNVGEWETINSFTEVDSNTIQTACVTDPMYLSC